MEGTFNADNAEDKENQSRSANLPGEAGGSKDCAEKFLVSQLRIRGICESDLEARLQRLIRRQKFEEAEDFARKYRFSPEEVRGRETTFLS